MRNTTIVTLFLVAASQTMAADGTAWFSTPLPPPQSDPRQPIMKHDDAFAPPGGATIPGGTLTAPVVYVGHGTDADLAGRDVKGRVAVVRVRPEPSLFGSAEQGVAARLVEKGAVGVINAVEGPGNANYI